MPVERMAMRHVREVLRLKFVGGVPTREIARRIGVPSRSRRLRILAEEAGHIYLDLADQHWQTVEIKSDGWRVNAIPPMRFHRRAGMLPLPVPERGGSDRSVLPAWFYSSIRDNYSVKPKCESSTQ